jgi:hypothetical protein
MSDGIETYECPSPDCLRTFGAWEEFIGHINTEHAGEYLREEWPDTPASAGAPQTATRTSVKATRSDRF